ncbi:Tetratricopeptide repeat protein [anaerobic digester metagenome]
MTHDYYPYQIPLLGWSDPKVLASLGIYVILIVIAIIGLRKKTLISYAILFYAVTFSIQSNLILNIGTFMNERFMFVSLIGFCTVIAAGFRWLFKAGSDNDVTPSFPYISRWSVHVLFVTVLIMAFSTFTRNFAWKNSETLVLTDVKTSVNSARCNYIAGFTLLEKARKEQDTAEKKQYYTDAALYLERGLNIYGKNTSALGNLGEVYIALGKLEDARTMYMRVLEQIPDARVAISNLRVISNLYVRDGKYNEAIQLLKTLATQTVIDPADYNSIGEIYGRNLNQLDSAELYFEKSLERFSGYAPALENMGLVQGMRGNYQKSLEYFLLAYPLDSTNADLLRNLSSTYRNLGNISKAEEMQLKADKTDRL